MAIRVFIGTEPKTKLAEEVLKFSIRRRTQETVEFTPMIGAGWEIPDDLAKGTGFSQRRYMIPKACGFEGRAIYMDADQLVFGNIFELWSAPEVWPAVKGTAAWMTFQPDKFKPKPWPQTAVMLIDCAAAKLQWDPEVLFGKQRRGSISYPDLMHGTWMKPQPRQIPDFWNHLNVYADGVTRLLHYTKEPEQPWYKPDHPLAKLWEKEFSAAIAAGAVSYHDFDEALALWTAPRLDHRKTQGLHPYYSYLRARLS